MLASMGLERLRIDTLGMRAEPLTRVEEREELMPVMVVKRRILREMRVDTEKARELRERRRAIQDRGDWVGLCWLGFPDLPDLFNQRQHNCCHSPKWLQRLSFPACLRYGWDKAIESGRGILSSNRSKGEAPQ